MRIELHNDTLRRLMKIPRVLLYFVASCKVGLRNLKVLQCRKCNSHENLVEIL